MSDPLSEVIQRLQPRAVFSRAIEGAGDWAVRYGAFGQPAFTVILGGAMPMRLMRRLVCCAGWRIRGSR